MGGAARDRIGPPLGRGHLRGQTFELPATDILEIPAAGARGRFLVEVDGHTRARRDLLAHLAGQRDAVGHRHPFDRNERDDVNGAHARVLARCARRSTARGAGDEQRHGRAQALSVAGKGQDAAVVGGVRLDVEHPKSGHAAERVDNRRDDVGADAFADVGHTFDDGHRVMLPPVGTCP